VAGEVRAADTVVAEEAGVVAEGEAGIAETVEIEAIAGIAGRPASVNATEC